MDDDDDEDDDEDDDFDSLMNGLNEWMSLSSLNDRFSFP